MENLSFYEDTQHSDGAPALQTVGRLDDRERKDGEEGEDNVGRRVASREISDCAGHEGKRRLRAGKAGGCKKNHHVREPGRRDRTE